MQNEITRVPFKRNGLRGRGFLHPDPVLASYGFSANFVERFWSFVEKTEHCWLWLGSLRDKGYGQIQCGGRSYMFKAHRASWIIHFGAIPEGKCVLHDCRPLPDCARCVNPAHLWLGTVLDNNADMDEKGVHIGPPHFCGEQSSRSVLTLAEAEHIRELYKSGKYFQKQLAEQFGLHKETIGRIVRHKTYV